MMRVLVVAAVATGLLASSAAAASSPEVISKPRDEITDLYLGQFDLSWNWRDGKREGSSLLIFKDYVDLPKGGEVTRPAGLVPAPVHYEGPDGRTAAYSHDGRLVVVADGKRSLVATHRQGVGHERFDQGGFRRALIWSERGRGLFGSASRRDRKERRPFNAFPKPRRLATGRIRATDLDVSGIVAGMAWQDGRNRIRARRIKGDRFLKALTVAQADGPVDDLKVFTDYGTLRVVWSTAEGVHVASKPSLAKRFGKPVKLAPEPATGIAAQANNAVVAFGQPGGIHYFAYCSDGLRQVVRPVAGIAHLDDFGSYPDSPGYTLDGEVHYGDEVLGAGHDLRIGLTNTLGAPAGQLRTHFYWLRGGRVLRGTLDRPLVYSYSGGIGPPSPCDDA